MTAAHQLRADLDYWKKSLRLQEWDISLKCDPKLRTYGQTEISPGNRTVVIYLEVPPSLGNAITDLEVTLVHELLHVRFHFLHVDEKEFGYEEVEAAIELTAQALVANRRSLPGGRIYYEA